MKVPDLYYNLLKFLKDNCITSIQYSEESDAIVFTTEKPSSKGGTFWNQYTFDAYGMEDNIIDYIQYCIDDTLNSEED